MSDTQPSKNNIKRNHKMALNNNRDRQRTRVVFVPVGGGGSNIKTEELSVSENGTYEAGEDKAYSKVTVKVTKPLGTVKIAGTGMKLGYSSFSKVPEWVDFEGVTDMNKMFYFCGNLSTIPEIDSSKVTDMTSMFDFCKSLTTIPLIDTSSVTNMDSMFNYCESLTTIPLIDTSSVTNMNSMFYHCESLTTIPLIDTSSVTNMNSMFNACYLLTTIPQLDTSRVTRMISMFSYCESLTTIPLIDTSSVTSMGSMLYRCYKLTDLGGFIGLKCDLDLYDSPLITHESLLNVINKAADVTASPATLTLGSTNLAKLTDEEKAIATNKGWTLA